MFMQAIQTDGFDIHLRYQPPNSPDMNILNLGFFNAIQALQHKVAPNTIDDLINAVQQAFHSLEVEKLNRVFLTLQQCMITVMRERRGNSYKILYMAKEKLDRVSVLPDTINVNLDLIKQVQEALTVQ
jgi:hypothetical protein